jgi:hypothetical protein
MTMAKVAYKHTFDAKMATNIGEDSVSDVIQAVLEHQMKKTGNF